MPTAQFVGHRLQHLAQIICFHFGQVCPSLDDRSTWYHDNLGYLAKSFSI